jgi:hypothetical protein
MPYPFTPYKIDSSFNQNVVYGKHEGLDLNGTGGGNADCDTPLKSISKGKCVHISHTTSDYGNLVVIEVIFKNVMYWIRYCHLNRIEVRPGDIVDIGTLIGTMGSTGNSTHCHLHLDILKKKPNLWRFYTQDVLDWFIDPVWFINNYKGDDMSETMIIEVKDYNRLRKASELGDKLINGLSSDDLYKGNIADKSEDDIKKMIDKHDDEEITSRVSDARTSQKLETIKAISKELGLPDSISNTSDLIRDIKALIDGQSNDDDQPGSGEPLLPTIPKGFELESITYKVKKG